METIFDSADTINSRYSSNFYSAAPSTRSPKLGDVGELMDLTGIFAMKSPLSTLASDMSVNFCIQNEAKTPRRCLYKDLANAQDEDDITSPIGKISLPAKRQFARTHTAFGRLQECNDKDTNNTETDHALERESTRWDRPPVPPFNRKDFKKLLKSNSGVSHWNARSSLSVPKKASTLVEPLKQTLQKREINTNIFEEAPSLLPFVHCQNHLKRIEPETLISLIKGNYQDTIDSFIIVDCRYPFEYTGGHIIGAENVSCEKGLQERFFSNPQVSSRKVVIFHCEYSLQRAPRMALHFRSTDRQLNEYPNLYYPEMYVLQGGYSNFYSKYPDLCDPKGYIAMNSKDHREELLIYGKRGLKKSFSEGFLSRE